MKATEAIKEVLKRNGISKAALARRLGMDPSKSAIRMRLEMDNIGVVKLSETLRALDYKIVVMPSDTRMNEEWIEIE